MCNLTMSSISVFYTHFTCGSLRMIHQKLANFEHQGRVPWSQLGEKYLYCRVIEASNWLKLFFVFDEDLFFEGERALSELSELWVLHLFPKSCDQNFPSAMRCAVVGAPLRLSASMPRASNMFMGQQAELLLLLREWSNLSLNPINLSTVYIMNLQNGCVSYPQVISR